MGNKFPYLSQEELNKFWRMACKEEEERMSKDDAAERVYPWGFKDGAEWCGNFLYGTAVGGPVALQFPHERLVPTMAFDRIEEMAEAALMERGEWPPKGEGE